MTENTEITKIDEKDISIVNSNQQDNKTLFHPASAIITLSVDVAFFGADAMALGVDLPVTITLAFLSAFVGTFFVQKVVANEKILPSIIKAIFLGIMAGIPFPIAGTAVGIFILGAAGLKKFSKKNKAIEK